MQKKWNEYQIIDTRQLINKLPEDEREQYKHKVLFKNKCLTDDVMMFTKSDFKKYRENNDASYHEVETFMATSIYLFSQCGGHGMYCFFEYFTPDFSNITEQDILNFIPQSVWAQTNVIEYR